MRLRCRCSNCGELVRQWIGMLCVPCHDLEVTAPLRQKLEYLKSRVKDYPILEVLLDHGG